MLGPAITATPWALPGVLAVIKPSVALNRRLVALLGSSPAVAFLLTMGLLGAAPALLSAGCPPG